MNGALDPARWWRGFSAPPIQSSRAGARRWAGTDPRMNQPPLTHHYMVVHLGGPKRIERRGDGPALVTDAALGSVTVVPAGHRYDWRTEGPIDFAHVYLRPDRLLRAAAELRRGDPSSFALTPRVGVPDELARALIDAMLDEAAGADELFIDTLTTALVARLVRGFGTWSAPARPGAALSARRLARVRDHVDAHLAEPLALADLAEVAGLSRFHFARAFRQATGAPPHAWVAARRLDEARRRLTAGDEPVAAIAAACGFTSPARLWTAFRRAFGRTPSDWRARGG